MPAPLGHKTAFSRHRTLMEVRIVSRPRVEKESKKATSFFPRLSGLRGPAIIVVAAVIAVGPLLWRGPPGGREVGRGGVMNE